MLLYLVAFFVRGRVSAHAFSLTTHKVLTDRPTKSCAKVIICSARRFGQKHQQQRRWRRRQHRHCQQQQQHQQRQQQPQIQLRLLSVLRGNVWLVSKQANSQREKEKKLRIIIKISVGVIFQLLSADLTLFLSLWGARLAPHSNVTSLHSLM